MWTPSTRPAFSATTFTKPPGSPRIVALPEADHGNRATSTS
jgi:hypothetical protein